MWLLDAIRRAALRIARPFTMTMAEETKAEKAKEEKVIVVAKRPADVQRMKLEKLMKNPVYELCLLAFLLLSKLSK